jgi:hypothetical protein
LKNAIVRPNNALNDRGLQQKKKLIVRNADFSEFHAGLTGIWLLNWTTQAASYSIAPDDLKSAPSLGVLER